MGKAITNFEYGIKTGDVFVQGYGFDGSDVVNFYEVTRVAARYLTLVRVAGKRVAGGVVPDLGHAIEEPIRRMTRNGGIFGRLVPCVPMPVSDAYPWDGEAC